MSMTKATTLDRRLYAWLAEVDEKRFLLAFNSYYVVAYPAILRRLVRVSGWESADLEDLAQEALLRFFEKIGRGRRDIAASMRETLKSLQPLPLGALHERQVRSWVTDVSKFLDATMTFRLTTIDFDEDWMAPIRVLVGRVEPLQTVGRDLLRPVRVNLEAGIGKVGVVLTLNPTGARDIASTQEESGATVMESNDEDQLAKALASDSALAANAEHHLPGVIQFVKGTITVVAHLPPLRVPTNAYLFETGMNIYLDEYRRRGRKKRGGRGVGPVTHEDRMEPTHPLEALVFEVDSEHDAEYAELGHPNRHANGYGELNSGGMANDPTASYESEDLYERFHEYLHRPVEEAMQALERAAVHGTAKAERRKFESVSDKFARIMAVLGLLGEGYTQEEAAARLALSRNQVKYIIELVQETYLRFESEALRQVGRNPISGDRSHGG